MEKIWQEKVERILNEPLRQIIDTNKGLTNFNFHVITEHFDVIVRIPREDSSNVVYRKHEELAHHLIDKTQLDIKTIYYDPKNGMKITEYIPDLKTFNEYHDNDRIERTAQLMRTLHQVNQCVGVLFNPIERYQKYRKFVNNPLINDALANRIISGISNLDRPLTLCHNDWVPGNICFTPKKDYLIDYEYAGDNDPFFDVMSFITENDLTQTEKEEFLTCYFNRIPSQSEKELLFNYQQFHNLLWCTWACMMYESRHEEIYATIANDKFNAIIK
jgi:thiamine kinase-like enzyme